MCEQFSYGTFWGIFLLTQLKYQTLFWLITFRYLEIKLRTTILNKALNAILLAKNAHRFVAFLHLHIDDLNADLDPVDPTALSPWVNIPLRQDSPPMICPLPPQA